MAVGGLLVLLGIIAWGLTGLSGDDLEMSGFILLVVVASIVLLPVILGGVFMILKGGAEQADIADVERQRKLLSIVQTRGQVSISDLVLDLQSTREGVESDLNDLVGRGLFSGYVDWGKGMLYSVEASKMRDMQTCPNCGGQLQMAGKGKISCPYCGADLFLS
jgi:ribosomal protein S27AE